jgi:hypothetical protein
VDSNELFRRLNEIETALELDKFRISGIDMWPFIRFQLVIAMNRVMANEDPGEEGYGRRVLRKAQALPAASWNLLGRAMKRKTGGDQLGVVTDVLVLTDSWAKRITFDGRWYDVVADPVLDHYEANGATYRVFETSQRFIVREPGFRNSVNLTGTMMWQYFRSVLLGHQMNVDEEFLRAHTRYAQLLREHGMEDRIMSVRALRFEASFIDKLAKHFAPILESLRPKLVLLVPYNSYAGRALCYTCRKLGIRTADIQHGVQGRFHPAYSAFANVPAVGFNTLPNVFLNWSQEDKEQIDEWAQQVPATSSHHLGNQLLETFLVDSELSRYYDGLFADRFPLARGMKKCVLITLVWGSELPDLFYSLIEECHSEYFFLVRFHPSTTQAERNRAIRRMSGLPLDSFDWQSASELPVYSLLRNVDANITEVSTTVIEAAHFGVKSVVTSERGRAYFRDYLQDGRAFYCTEVDEIARVLDGLKDGRAASFGEQGTGSNREEVEAMLLGLLSKRADLE